VVVTAPPESKFEVRIREAGLKPSLLEELDWSGKGQFVEFQSGETAPLIPLKELSSSPIAVVDEVLCKRIRLARKSMIYRPESRLKSALEEIKHLRKLDHGHIVRIVGAYVEGITISILTYPVADCDLGTFLQSFHYVPWDDYSVVHTEETYGEMLGNLSDKLSLAKMPNCLIHALAFVHSNSIRHLDINILVRKNPYYFEPYTLNGMHPLWHGLIERRKISPHKVYLCDFGISTSFVSDHDTKTTSPTARTATYCAPEVDKEEKYSRAVDVFSLGCVFAEIFTCLVGEKLDSFVDARAGVAPDSSSFAKARPDKSFQANIPRVYHWLTKLATSPKTQDRDLMALDLVFKDFHHDLLNRGHLVFLFEHPFRRGFEPNFQDVQSLSIPVTTTPPALVFRTRESMSPEAKPLAPLHNPRPRKVHQFTPDTRGLRFLEILFMMLNEVPDFRPTSAHLASITKRAVCCNTKGEPFMCDVRFDTDDNPYKEL
jgi:serine/threonine protein kinase